MKEEEFNLPVIVQLEKDLERVLSQLKPARFSREMVRELKNNEYKGNWENFTDVGEIQSELDYHIEKLYDKVSNVVVIPEGLKESIADCANILMFLGNSYGLYDE